MDRQGGAYKDRRLILLSTVGLIDRFIEGISLDELYERAIRHYDILLEIIEGNETLAEVLSYSKYSLEKIKRAALNIVDTLLHNNKGDPFLSLGLTRNTSFDILKKRWKRLISLYHPDLYPDYKEYEEKAKRINAAYNDAIRILENRDISSEKSSGKVSHKYRRRDFEPYMKSISPELMTLLKRLPLFIIISMVFVAFITIGFFIKYKMDEKNIMLNEEAKRSVKEEKKTVDKNQWHFYQSYLFVSKNNSIKKEKKIDKIKPLDDKKSLDIQTESEFEITKKYILKDLDSQGKEDRERQGSEERETSSIPQKEDVKSEKTFPNYTLAKEQENKVAKEVLIKNKKDKEEKEKPLDSKKSPNREISSLDKQDKQKDIKKEIHAFLQKYKRYYEGGDLSRFLSLFADDATENGKKISKLKEDYRRIFAESENRYTLKDVVIELKDINTAEVRAKFDIQRLIKRDGRVYRYRGDVKWIIKIKEDELKIVNLYYE